MGNFLSWLIGGPTGQDEPDGRRPLYDYYIEDVLTGTPDNIFDDLKNLICKFAKGATAEYIGMASGDDGRSAMMARMDEYKKSEGIHEMRLLYKTTSHKNVVKVETELIEYSKKVHPNINKNQIGGGTGRVPNNPKYYFVYAAYGR